MIEFITSFVSHYDRWQALRVQHLRQTMNRGAVDVVVGGWHEGSVVVGGWHKGSSEPDHATREQLLTVVPPPGGR